MTESMVGCRIAALCWSATLLYAHFGATKRGQARLCCGGFYDAGVLLVATFFQGFAGGQPGRIPRPSRRRGAFGIGGVAQVFFFNDAPTPDIYTLSLHDAACAPSRGTNLVLL